MSGIQPAKSTGSLLSILLRRSVPVTVLLLALAGLGILEVAERTSLEQAEQRLQALGMDRQERIQTRLDSLVLQTRNLADSSLVVNGLIDLEGRDYYMPPFFRTLRFASPAEVGIVLTDYRGRILYANGPGEGMALDPEAWLEPVVEKGDFHFDLSPDRILIAAPVIYSGLPEGGLLVRVEKAQMARLFDLDLRDFEVAFLDSSGRVIAGAPHFAGQQGEMMPELSAGDWLTYRANFPDHAGISMILATSLEAGLAQLSWVRNFLIGAFLVSFVIAVFSVLMAATLARRQIARLTSWVQGVRRLEDTEHGPDMDGPDEIRKLKETFNDMLASLRETTTSRDYLDGVLSGIADGLITIDRRGRIKTVNQAVERIFGYASDEMVGQDVSMLMPKEERAAHRRYLRESGLHGTRVINQLRDLTGQRKDGSLFAMELVVSTLGQGEDRNFIGVCRDVTAQREAARNLAESEQKYRSIVETASDGFAQLDPLSGRILDANPALCDFLGSSREELIGRELMEFLSPDQTRLLREERRQVTPEAEFMPLEISLGLPGTDRRHFRYQSKVIWNENGVELAEFVFLSDLTREVEIRQTLEDARRSAEEAARSKSQFLANMSHEIRTPMNGVIGMLELLRESGISREQRRLLNTALQSADMQMTVINDILDYSKIEAGKLEVSYSDFSLEELLVDACSLLSTGAEAKQIQLTCYTAPEVPAKVNSDPARLRQVMVNLIGNAIKFTESGGVSVSCQRQAAEGGKEELLIRVSDTGIGISKAEIAKLFKPFAQADSTATRKFGGTGLGLMISKNIVEALGGSIGVESEPGKGSTFWLRLDMAAVDREHDYPPELSERKILIVDESPEVCRIFGNYLMEAAALVDTENTWEAALVRVHSSLAQGQPYDLILIGCSGRDGEAADLAGSIRSLDGARDARMMMLCAFAPPSAATLKAAGFEAPMPKLITRRRLYREILFNRRERDAVDGVDRQGAAIVNLTGARILLVEDTEINQKVALNALARIGLEADLAVDGLEALSKMSGGPFDLVLMDIQMPKMDGYEVTRIYREHEKDSGTGRVPIIALTAHALTGDREQCLAAGMDDYLPKPVRLDALTRILEKWLHGIAREEGDEPLPFADENAETGTEDKVLDPNALDALFRTVPAGSEVLEQLVASFLETVPGMLDSLRASSGGQEGETVTRTAHSLKSCAMTFGALNLANLARELEQGNAEMSADEIGECVSELEAEFQRVSVEVEALAE